MDKRCYICGVMGLPKRIVSCVKCRSSFIHVYCMKVKPVKGTVPYDWMCEDCCETPKHGSNKFIDDVHARKRPLKVIPTDEAIALASSNPSMSKGKRHLASPEKAFKPSKIQSTVPLHTLSSSDLHFSNQRNHILQKNSYKKHHENAHIPPEVPLKSCLKKPTSSMSSPNLQNCKEVSFPSHIISKTSKCGTAQGDVTCKDMLKASKKPKEQMTVDRHLPNHPASHATWKGRFRICGFAAPVKSCNIFWGYPAAKVRRKAYEFSLNMPDVLQLKAINRCSIWANMFNGGGPDKNDIGLYFFPSDDTFERSYSRLVSNLLNEDAVLRSRIHGTDLLIFTSSHLDDNSKKINHSYYLWGLFVPPSVSSKKPHQNQQHTQENEGESMGNLRDTKEAALVAGQPCPPGYDTACRVGRRAPPGCEETSRRVKNRTVDRDVTHKKS